MPVGSEKLARGEGMRYNDEKVPLDMVPLHLLGDAAKVLHHVTTREEKPYPPWNWAKGMDWNIAYGCALRHLAAWWRGESDDPETGLPHLGHAMCNLLFLTHYAEAYPEGDNRPGMYFMPGGMDEEEPDNGEYTPRCWGPAPDEGATFDEATLYAAGKQTAEDIYAAAKQMDIEIAETEDLEAQCLPSISTKNLNDLFTAGGCLHKGSDKVSTGRDGYGYSLNAAAEEYLEAHAAGGPISYDVLIAKHGLDTDEEGHAQLSTVIGAKLHNGQPGYFSTSELPETQVKFKLKDCDRSELFEAMVEKYLHLRRNPSVTAPYDERCAEAAKAYCCILRQRVLNSRAKRTLWYEMIREFNLDTSEECYTRFADAINAEEQRLQQAALFTETHVYDEDAYWYYTCHTTVPGANFGNYHSERVAR